MNYFLDISAPRKQKMERLSEKFWGKDKDGNELGFNQYHMEINGKPFFGISGECHYARVAENQWEDTILKMKMGGINVISTYIFWIHHEEEEEVFRFDGNRNVRKFIQLCQKYGMYVIVRIGPFDHGEVRNGGLPDWLYGKPFEVRSIDEGFLFYTRRFYQKLAEQFKGLYYKDGGPIIGTQLDNEYMHSGAPWELTTGVTNEWVSIGNQGKAYMRKLKEIAVEEGIITPFYTCTAWGGAAMDPEEMLPLWGGYAFWPWIFYNWQGEHPATPEYLYRDNHNNQVPETYNFKPDYKPESFPYACCEMGGGMACYYHYRFVLPFESVDAMANVKLASGCNFLGYYMYRGGSNPKGKTIPYLNECQCTKISYDYQAAIGEYGQLRPSFYRLKVLHSFLQYYQDRICKMVTMLPEGSQEIETTDVDTLRFAVRTDGKSGFLFLNNYQDHVICKEKQGENVTLKLSQEDISIEGISMAAGEEAILPFGMDLDGYTLLYAKAQPLSILREEKQTIYFFFAPDGMEPEFYLDTEKMEEINGKKVLGKRIRMYPWKEADRSFVIRGEAGEVKIVTLTRQESLDFYQVNVQGRQVAVLSDSPFLFDGDKIQLEKTEREESILKMYPPCKLKTEEAGKIQIEKLGLWEEIRFFWKEEKEDWELNPEKCGPYRYKVEIPTNFEDCEDIRLQINYRGDMASAFFDGVLVSDNFSNGELWEIGLKEVWKPEMGNILTILIVPKKLEAEVDVSSTMAGRAEMVYQALGELKSVKAKKMRRMNIKCE